jgi:nucleoid-associated protein EbfC
MTPMNIMQVMKQAQELQGKLKAMQDELAALEVLGQSGAGLVSVKLNGKGEMLSLHIDPKLMKPGEAEIVEDLVVAAYQDARTKSDTARHERMSAATAGLPIPPGMLQF